jgi:hypothetical protein
MGDGLIYGLTVISVSIDLFSAFLISCLCILVMQRSGMFKNFVSTRCKSLELNKVSLIEKISFKKVVCKGLHDGDYIGNLITQHH